MRLFCFISSDPLALALADAHYDRLRYICDAAIMHLLPFLIQDCLNELKTKAKLAAYVLPSSRNAKTGVDSLLFIQNEPLRKLILAWRRNILGSYMI